MQQQVAQAKTKLHRGRFSTASVTSAAKCESNGDLRDARLSSSQVFCPGTRLGHVAGLLIMQSPVVRSRRKPRRLPGLWVAVLLALVVHAGVGFGLFWDAVQPQDVDPTARMGAAPSHEEMDATARMGAPPAPETTEPAPTQRAQPRTPAEAAAPIGDRSIPGDPGTAAARRGPQGAAQNGASAKAALRPSFDCQFAQSVPEQLICSDPGLARLDRDYARLYVRAKFATRDPVAFRQQTQDEWRRREETCTDRACLLEWYARRRKQLTEVIAQAPAQPR